MNPLHGLVLAGGESRRMGRDKALLSYDGQKSQLERTSELLLQCCSQVFISQREEQAFPLPDRALPLYDSIDEIKGPLCGILSALKAHPEADWLVLACDLPNLVTDDLKHLIEAYHNLKTPHFTAYQSHYDSLPEPLCAIYPSGSELQLRNLSRKLGKFCPRKLLIVSEAKLVLQPNPHSLDNVNTAEEFEAFRLSN